MFVDYLSSSYNHSSLILAPARMSIFSAIVWRLRAAQWMGLIEESKQAKDKG